MSPENAEAVIRKCLNLGLDESGAEGERANAMDMARKLADEHGFNIDDLIAEVSSQKTPRPKLPPNDPWDALMAAWKKAVKEHNAAPDMISDMADGLREMREGLKNGYVFYDAIGAVAGLYESIDDSGDSWHGYLKEHGVKKFDPSKPFLGLLQILMGLGTKNGAKPSWISKVSGTLNYWAEYLLDRKHDSVPASDLAEYIAEFGGVTEMYEAWQEYIGKTRKQKQPRPSAKEQLEAARATISDLEAKLEQRDKCIQELERGRAMQDSVSYDTSVLVEAANEDFCDEKAAAD